MRKTNSNLIETAITKIVRRVIMEAFWEDETPPPAKTPKSAIEKQKLGLDYEVGDKFKHKAYPDDLQIELLAKTNNGWKVTQRERRGKKFVDKIAYYSKLDFDPKKGIWVPE